MSSGLGFIVSSFFTMGFSADADAESVRQVGARVGRRSRSAKDDFSKDDVEGLLLHFLERMLVQGWKLLSPDPTSYRLPALS
jgi:hypothetical protein